MKLLRRIHDWVIRCSDIDPVRTLFLGLIATAIVLAAIASVLTALRLNESHPLPQAEKIGPESVRVADGPRTSDTRPFTDAFRPTPDPGAPTLERERDASISAADTERSSSPNSVEDPRPDDQAMCCADTVCVGANVAVSVQEESQLAMDVCALGSVSASADVSLPSTESVAELVAETSERLVAALLPPRPSEPEASQVEATHSS